MKFSFEAALTYLKEQTCQNPGLNIAFNGDLGAGKTTFISHLVGQLDPCLTAEVSSPSFAICNNYVGQRVKIDHFDLYRLEQFDQLDEVGLFESLDQPSTLTWVEWANLFEKLSSFFDFTVEIQGVGASRSYHITSFQR